MQGLNVIIEDGFETIELNTLPSMQDLQDAAIKKIAFTALQECAVSLLFSAASCVFVATPFSMLALCAGNMAMIVSAAFMRYLMLPLIDDQEAILKEIYACLGPYLFAVTDLCSRSVLSHEMGHAIAAQALYLTPVKIEIFPFEGGMMKSNRSVLSDLGNYFGHSYSNLIISAAGPAIDLISSLVFIGVAHKIQKKYPDLSRYLNMMAAVTLLNVTFYAASAFFTSFPGHDFIALAKGGIPPIVSLVTLIGTPIIFKLGLIITI